MKLERITMGVLAVVISVVVSAATAAEPKWVVYDGFDGAGKGKEIVLISGDEEYRSEEALPQLGKILAKHHGFKCTVVFSQDPKSGVINPDNSHNIPGLEALKTADLMIIATRFRDLVDDQMAHIDAYVRAGKPIIGMRTATHAFNIGGGKKYSSYSFNRKGGFGKQILGDTWLNHHGHHGRESTRGLIAKGQENHPILKGIKDGDIWGPTDVYGVRPLADTCKPLVMGQVLKGMKFGDEPVEGRKNNPMMPVSWTNSHKGDGGATGRVFTTTMGAATDLLAEGTRRMMVNAAYWAVGLEGKIPAKSKVDIVGVYKPLQFGFGKYKRGVKPSAHLMK
ncbi:MAG: hypothetical protein CMJ99_10260 [Planctomycetes bacterium]|nr:hypothetical protein [Planctomycetota bacterium]